VSGNARSPSLCGLLSATRTCSAIVPRASTGTRATGAALPPGATIPRTRTSPALDLDVLVGGFKPLFRALDPEQVNKLSVNLLAALQGEGIRSTPFWHR